MLLLFWTGVYDGAGDIDSISVLTGNGVRVDVGTGSLVSVSVLTGSGSGLYPGVGSILSVALLSGIAEVITPSSTYLFTIMGIDGTHYSFVAENDEASIARYTTEERSGTVEYSVKPVGRIIP